MATIVEQFGKTVSKSIEKSPARALTLLRAGYFASGKQMQFLPDPRLMPHQKYAAVVCNRAIRAPLARPEHSAVVSVFTPCGFLHALKIAPQFTEGLACYFNGAGAGRAFLNCAENAGVPKTFCSYHKTLLGAAVSGVLPKPRFIVNTTLACDANNSTFRMLADIWNVPHFTLDVPYGLGDGAVSYLAEQLTEFKAFLEDVTGRKLHENALREVIRRENRSMRLYRETFDLLSCKAMSNDMDSEMLKIFLTHVLLGTPEAERYFGLMLEDARKAAPSNGEIRILWAHTLPFWQNSMKSILNFNPKYRLLCCDMNFDALFELDEAHPCESLARKLISHTMAAGNERRAETLIKMAKALRADGVVYFCHWGCKQTTGGAAETKRMLEKAGIPTLILDGDGCDSQNVNDGQMYTRLQAFAEMLEAGK